MKTLSVVIICKNEEQNLSRLLPKLGFAEQIVVVDTGSADGSVAVAEKYAQTYFFEWCNDFAKARNYAISKAACDYVMWLDCDDDLPVSTVDAIEKWKRDDAQNADFVYLKYRMGASSQFWFWRERIIRNCKQCRFKGFIHEAIAPFGQTQYLDCEVVHTSVADHSARNLAIYREALANGKRFTLRDKFYYARTLTERGLHDEAEPLLIAVANSGKAYAPDRVSALKLLARRYAHKDSIAALKYLSKSVTLLPPDAEICCLFGDTYFEAGNYAFAARWYELAMRTRFQTGFVNDYFKSLYPCIQLSVCFWRLGDVNQAKFYHCIAKNNNPLHPAVVANDRWLG